MTLFTLFVLGAACSGEGDPESSSGDAPGDDAGVTSDMGAGLDAGPDAGIDAGPRGDAGTGADPFVSDCAESTSTIPGLVTTSVGDIQGIEDGDGAWQFLGIPFAEAPVGDLRWRAPVKPGCLEEQPFVADAFGPACPQLGEDGVVGDEDCLQLNIWTPADYTAEAKLPVLFFIHGGANILGSASQGFGPGRPAYTGRFLAETEDVVVVTVQYRLGPLGFLALPELSSESENDASGHYAPLDHIAALEWVRDNVSRFGGDPERVLLFGQSAGAINVCTLVASPLARNLFSSALMQSGLCTGEPLAEAEEGFGASVDVFEECRDATDRLACLRALPAERIVAAIPGTIEELAYGPVVDGYVLPDSPLALIARGEHNDVPFVLGSTADEMASETIFSLEVETAAEYEALIAAEFGAFGEDTVATILELYPVEDYATPQEALIQVYTDRAFTRGTRTLARAASGASSSPVYRYLFSKTTQSVMGTIPARHGIDLLYVFDVLGTIPVFPTTPADQRVADAMVASWSALARSGDPNASALGARWEAYDAARDDFVDFGATVSAGEGIRREKCDFWDSLTAR
ncbi:MAG: carboxylesterase family protein [Myxococcota bacterium]